MNALMPCALCACELLNIPIEQIETLDEQLVCNDCAADIARIRSAIVAGDPRYDEMRTRDTIIPALLPEAQRCQPVANIVYVPTHPKNRIRPDGYPAPVAPKAPRRSLWTRFLDGLWHIANLLDGGDGC